MNTAGDAAEATDDADADDAGGVGTNTTDDTDDDAGVSLDADDAEGLIEDDVFADPVSPPPPASSSAGYSTDGVAKRATAASMLTSVPETPLPQRVRHPFVPETPLPGTPRSSILRTPRAVTSVSRTRRQSQI